MTGMPGATAARWRRIYGLRLAVGGGDGALVRLVFGDDAGGAVAHGDGARFGGGGEEGVEEGRIGHDPCGYRRGRAGCTVDRPKNFARLSRMIRQLAPLALCCLAGAALARSAAACAGPRSSPAEAPRPATVKVSLQTSEGPILLELESEAGAQDDCQFPALCRPEKARRNKLYRASKVPGAPESRLVQGGVRYDPKRVLPAIAHEPTTQTGLSHLDGTISMARNAPARRRATSSSSSATCRT